MLTSDGPALRRWQPDEFAGAPGGPKGGARAATADLETRRRKAAEEGYAAGYRDGQAAAKQVERRLGELLASTERSLALMEERLAGDLVNLATDLAREVLRVELRSNRESLVAVAGEALALLSQEATAVRVLANPSDAGLLRTRLADDLARGRWTLTEDPRIEPGGVRVLSSTGNVDATLGTRWRRVLATLGQDQELHVPPGE